MSVYLLEYFLFQDFIEINVNKQVKMISTITRGKNHIDMILPSIAKPISENKAKVKIIPPTKQIETGTAYFQGVKSTTALFSKTKGSFRGLTFPKINKNIVSIKNSKPWI